MRKYRTTLIIALFLTFYTYSSQAAELSADYLEGAWCYSHAVSGGERNDENRNLVFEKDGTFSYQQSLNNSKLTPGFKYEVLPGTLKLKPVFPGALKVKSVDENEMILNYFMDLYFIRGECSSG